ncbi:MAG: hypothetical protein WB683_20035 [Candidatus Sulfotelmatobacter sp.]
MFDEIPSPPNPNLPSKVASIAGFGLFLATFLTCSAIAWFRWSSPLSLSRKISVAEFVLGILFSGVFLLTAKSASPERNRRRMTGLVVAVTILALIGTVLR